LCSMGYLSRTAGVYSLGPRIIELDYYIQQCDPMLLASRPVMRQLRDKLDCDVLLTNFYDNRVIVSHHERGSDEITVSYGRGRLMPLFRGPASKVILGQLSVSRQRALFTEHQAEISAVGMGADWASFRKNLLAIRRAGYAVSIAELDAGNIGIAVPIRRDNPDPPGGLVIVLREKRFAIIDRALVIKILSSAAEDIGVRMKQIGGAEWDKVLDLESHRARAS
jgi:DNA-binding IclR family transcriptional regulator